MLWRKTIYAAGSAITTSVAARVLGDVCGAPRPRRCIKRACRCRIWCTVQLRVGTDRAAFSLRDRHRREAPLSRSPSAKRAIRRSVRVAAHGSSARLRVRSFTTEAHNGLFAPATPPHAPRRRNPRSLCAMPTASTCSGRHPSICPTDRRAGDPAPAAELSPAPWAVLAKWRAAGSKPGLLML